MRELLILFKMLYSQRDDVDFLIICCDINDTRMDSELPSYVKLMKRDNIGFDFGAWSEWFIQR